MKWKDKLQKLRSSSDSDRAFSHVLLFFFVMVLLTLIARGTAGSRLARVTVTTPTSQDLSQSVQLYGTAKPIGNYFSTVPAGLTVSQVKKGPLDSIVKGDVIAVIDQPSLDELVIRERARLRQMELQLESQLKWAYVSDRDLKNAQKNYDRAKEKYDRLQADEDSSKEDILAAMAKVDEARIALGLAQEEYYEEMLLEEPAARTLVLDIDAAAARVNELMQLKAQEYQIIAGSGGIVADQPLTEGCLTNGTEIISISTPGNGFTLTFQARQEDALGLFRYEPQLTATQEEAEEVLRSYNADVSTLDQPTVTFTAKLRQTAWTDGSITITGKLWQDDYDTCVPMSALRQDSHGYFVYVMETTQTLMGIDKRVTRVSVSIEKTDGRYAAVSGLSGHEQVILSSSKPLSDGDSVRVGQ